jgi:hypothetical protein
MHDCNLASLRSERTCKRGVGVTKHQYGIRLTLRECCIQPTHHDIKSLGAVEISWFREEEVGWCHPQVAVDLAGKQLIVVLGGINNERLNGR